MRPRYFLGSPYIYKSANTNLDPREVLNYPWRWSTSMAAVKWLQRVIENNIFSCNCRGSVCSSSAVDHASNSGLNPPPSVWFQQFTSLLPSLIANCCWNVPICVQYHYHYIYIHSIHWIVLDATLTTKKYIHRQLSSVFRNYIHLTPTSQWLVKAWNLSNGSMSYRLV